MGSYRQTQSTYDLLSRWYDLLSGPAERKYTSAGLALLHLQPGERALEIGFGTGHALLELAAQVGVEGRVTGLDLSMGMVGVAGQRLREQGLSDCVDLVCGDARSLPLQPETVGVVFLSFTLELFQPGERSQVLSECRRVLAAGGRIGVVSLYKPPRSHLGVAVYEWFHRCFPRFIDCQPIDAVDWISQAGLAVDETRHPVLMGILPLEILVGHKPAAGSNFRY